MTDEVKEVYDNTKVIIDGIDKCKIFKVSPEQVNVFYRVGIDMKIDLDQAMGVRLPFQNTYIEFTDPVIIYRGEHDEKDKIRGALLQKIDEKYIGVEAKRKLFNEVNDGFSWEEHVERSEHQYACAIFYADMNLIGFLDCMAGVQFYCSDFPCGRYKESELGELINNGLCICPYLRFKDEYENLRCHTILHIAELGLMIQSILNYINSRNVDRVYVNPNTRKRVEKGKELLPYYECKIHPSKTYEDYHGTGEGTPHSFRYDVRGHFRKIDKGFIWVGDHQRGLRHTLYKPKIWVKEEAD